MWEHCLRRLPIFCGLLCVGSDGKCTWRRRLFRYSSHHAQVSPKTSFSENLSPMSEGPAELYNFAILFRKTICACVIVHACVGVKGYLCRAGSSSTFMWNPWINSVPKLDHLAQAVLKFLQNRPTFRFGCKSSTHRTRRRLCTVKNLAVYLDGTGRMSKTLCWKGEFETWRKWYWRELSTCLVTKCFPLDAGIHY